MKDINVFAQMARMVYQYQPGLLGIEVDCNLPNCIRFSFSDNETAMKFFRLRALQKGMEGKSENLLLDGCDVVEVWD